MLALDRVDTRAVPRGFAGSVDEQPALRTRDRHRRGRLQSLRTMGTGAEAVGWGLVLLAIGYVLRLAMHRMAFTRPSIPIAPDV